jgi:DNA invertase Pin-like site-specific DNA recombinase
MCIKEYIDDGYSGSQLDRPALDQLRTDVKAGFEAIYFLDTDRIARDVAYQTIILGELLKHGKQIITKGKDYVNNPENKFAVTVLGAVAELERAKIIERTTRGRLHRLRQGEMCSSGHHTFGYDYVRKTPTSPAALVINEEQAAIVRWMLWGCSSSRRWQRVARPSGKVSVYHHADYRCNRRANENMHDRTQIERCTNSRLSTHILEGKVFEMIQETMLDPGMLRACIDTGGAPDDRSIARELIERGTIKRRTVSQNRAAVPPPATSEPPVGQADQNIGHKKKAVDQESRVNQFLRVQGLRRSAPRIAKLPRP